MHKRTYSLVALAVLIGGSTFTYARMGTNDSRLIPYSGTLRSGGAAANGVYDMRFGLFATDPGAAPACLDTDPTTCTPWGEEQQVTVSAGNFAVALGDSNAIIDTDISSNAMYLAIAVKGPSDVDFTHIGNHEIIPVPWAARAATSTNYEVTGNLTVGGTTVAQGRLRANHGGPQRGLEIRWNQNTGQGETDFVNLREGGAGGFRFYNSLNLGDTPSLLANLSSGGTLSLSGGLSAAGGVSGTSISGTSLSSSGDVVANGNTPGSCTNHATAVPGVNFSDNYDGHLLTECPDGKFMNGVWTKHYQEGSNFRDRWVTYIRCCEL